MSAEPPIPRLSARVFFNDVADELFSLDRGAPYTLAQLLWRPGPTVRRYIEQRDPRLTKPFRLVLICLAVAALILHLSGISDGYRQGMNSDAGAAIGDAAGLSFRLALGVFFEKFDVMLVLCWVPAVAASMQWVYRKHALNTAEAFVFGLYTLALLIVLMQPLIWLMGYTGAIHWFAILLIICWPMAFPAHGYFRPEAEPLRRALATTMLSLVFLFFLMLGMVMGMTLWFMAKGPG